MSAEPTQEEIQKALTSREYVFNELIQTEKAYVQDLFDTIDGYKKAILNETQLPEILNDGKCKMVFGNIETIYEWHRDVFLKALEGCVQNPKELGKTINKNKTKLEMYVAYCRNKPFSEFLVHSCSQFFEEIRVKLNQRLSLADMLIKPVQRMTKYEMLLRDILKYTELAGESYKEDAIELKKALVIMKEIPESANQMMDAARIKNFDGSITAQGKLLLNDTMLCLNHSAGNRNSLSRAKKMRVFLFEQALIFADISRMSTFNTNSYIYKAHIQVNKMTMRQVTDSHGKKFKVESTDPQKEGVCYACHSEDPLVTEKWIDKINGLLDKQRKFIEALTKPGGS